MADYKSPLNRYASDVMKQKFSNDSKFGGWRKVWIALAEAQHEMGLPVTEEQIAELKEHQYDIPYERARQIEKEIRHDVMAHVRAYGEQCLKAKPIIHLGATSAEVTDNAELYDMRDTLDITCNKTAKVIGLLSRFADKYKDMPCLGYTHFQAAQPVTVGKRATLWAYDLVLALYDLQGRKDNLKARGLKGTTGTNASYLTLLKGDKEKLKKLNEIFCKKLGFDSWYEVTGQTYPRMVDTQVLSSLAETAAAAHKFGTDLRLLAHEKEMEEPFEKGQVGSSAMAYKRNPMRAERICSLSRHVIKLAEEASTTQATQWLERTLDDSAGRRFYISESFLTLDAVLDIYSNVASGLVVYPAVVKRNLMGEFPFMVTEEILMKGVERGGDRQELHEIIRTLSQAAGDKIKKEGADNTLLEDIAADKTFSGLFRSGEIIALAEKELITSAGDCIGQVNDFNRNVVAPILERYKPNLDEVKGLDV